MYSPKTWFTAAFVSVFGFATCAWTEVVDKKQGNPPAPAQAVEASGGAKAAHAIWTFAWASDLHLDAPRQELILKAFRCIDDELKPRFVLFTGDNNAIPADPRDASRPESIGVRRQQFFKAFLDRRLKTPYVVIPGDNWPEGFDQVFGARQYSLDYGGLHFLLLAPDRTYRGHGAEGLSVLDQPTWKWIGEDLDRSRRKPTLVAIHEPLVPCTFLDAPPLRDLVDRFPNVIAVLQGHLHVDLEFRAGQRVYLVAPSLGKGMPPAFKLVEVHPEKLIVRTMVCATPAGQFTMTSRRQKIALIQPEIAKPTQPGGTGFTMNNYCCVPPHPHVDDPTLAGRAGELWKSIGQNIGQDLLRWHRPSR